jgi:putative transposase
VAYYHVWFATKRRKWILQGDVADKVKEVIALMAMTRKINLIEYETIVDHMHLLVEAESDHELSWFMRLIKGRSAYETFRAFPELKIDAGIDSLWQDGFNSRMVPRKQLAIVRRYIRTQDERLEKYER